MHSETFSISVQAGLKGGSLKGSRTVAAPSSESTSGHRLPHLHSEGMKVGFLIYFFWKVLFDFVFTFNFQKYMLGRGDRKIKWKSSTFWPLFVSMWRLWYLLGTIEFRDTQTSPLFLLLTASLYILKGIHLFVQSQTKDSIFSSKFRWKAVSCCPNLDER